VPGTALYYLELRELTPRIHAKEISPVEATQAQLDRIASLDTRLRRYALVTADLALEQAEAEITRGEIRGPLHGAPIAVKDLCWTKGSPNPAGCQSAQSFVLRTMRRSCASCGRPGRCRCAPPLVGPRQARQSAGCRTGRTVR
jgi:amidase